MGKLTKKERTEKRYAYHTDPEVGEAIDLKAVKLAKSLPSPEISHELALYGYTLLMEREGEIIIINPSHYNLTLKKELLEKL